MLTYLMIDTGTMLTKKNTFSNLYYLNDKIFIHTSFMIRIECDHNFKFNLGYV